MTEPGPGTDAASPDVRLDGLLDRLRDVVHRGGRIVGIAGAPGAGKSTLASRLVEAWGPGACVLPMDGFHLAQDELVRLGRADRKGAPDTFDVDGYVAALARVRQRRHDVLVPRFDRDLEEPIAQAIRISVEHGLVVTEGNYLALDRSPWTAVGTLLDECWWLDIDDDTRRARLRRRHEAHGRRPDAARRWVEDVDEPNAHVVTTSRRPVDLVVRVP